MPTKQTKTSEAGHATPTTLRKPRKSIEVVVLVPYFLVTVLVTLTIGLIAGYFTSIELHSNAREAVVQDMAVASKTSEKQ